MMALHIQSVIFICFLTILLAYDYFAVLPDIIKIPQFVFQVTFFVLFIISMIIGRDEDDSNSWKWQVFIIVYIVTLMLVFSLLGGKSSVGISFSNTEFWIVLGISLIQIYIEWRKQKSSDQNKHIEL